MKRLIVPAVAALVLALVAGGTLAYGQATFKIPFKFKAGGKSFPAGEYRVAEKGESSIAFRKLPNGEEAPVAFSRRLAQPSPPLTEPRLVFDVVGNFEPSYTEYVTEYVLAEAWLPGKDGFLVHTTKGAHQSKTITGTAAN
jgi:hypothetical protein